MHLTVAICSWNRARLLRQTLASFRDMVIPPDVTWELVVVDNNSTDDTAGVVGAATDHLPIRPIFESTPGVANARNRAVAESQGDYILWTDDDVIVDPDWLVEYVAAFRRRPDVALFGGYSKVVFEGDPPDWFLEALPVIGGIFGDLPRLDGPIRLGDQRLPYTVNMAVRTDVQKQYAFDPKLGRKEGQQLSHEDAEVVRAIIEGGFDGLWLPEAMVEHVVAIERQTEEYLRRWYDGFGRTMTLLESDRGGRSPLWAWKQAIVHEILYRLTRRTASPVRWARHLQLARVARGYLRRDGSSDSRPPPRGHVAA